MKLKTIHTVVNHPLNRNNKVLALINFLKRGLVTRLHPYPLIYPFIENTFLVTEKGMTSAELQVYTGLYDTAEMLFILHFLRAEDTFVDIGANIGVYTLLASGISGANSIAYEPIPSTFEKLVRNINYNNLASKVELVNCGVGAQEQTLLFSVSLGAINHVVTEDNFIGNTIEIPLNSLDNLLKSREVNVLKIDVEGYEANVIKGASKILSSGKLEVIVMETNGLGVQYSFDQNCIHNSLLDFGFLAYDYLPYQRILKPILQTNAENTIYIRNIDFVTQRVKEGRKIKVRNQMI